MNPDQEHDDSPAPIHEINAQSCEGILSLIGSSLGPTGRDKMLVDDTGMVVITNDGATILGEMDVEHDLVPAARMISQLAQEQNKRVGDGTKTAVLLTAGLITRASDLINRGIHPNVIVDGYQEAAAVTQEHIEAVASEISKSDITELESIVEMAMAGRGPESTADSLARLVVEAILQIDPATQAGIRDITFTKVTGGTVQNSSLLRGLVVDTTEPLRITMPTKVDDPGVLCYSSNLTVSQNTSGENQIAISKASEYAEALVEEKERAETIATLLESEGVGVVFCDSEIDPLVGKALSKRDILAFKRVVAADLNRIAKATNTSTVKTLHGIQQPNLGNAGTVEIRDFNGYSKVVLSNCQNPASLSFILRGGTEHGVDEIERAVKNGLGVVRATLENGLQIPGGGATEVQIASHLRDHARGVNDRSQFAINAYADAVDQLPRILATNMGLDSTDAITELRSQHAQGNSTAGLLADGSIVEDVLAEHVYESAFVKSRAIAGATETASSVIRIDDLVSVSTSAAEEPGAE